MGDVIAILRHSKKVYAEVSEFVFFIFVVFLFLLFFAINMQMPLMTPLNVILEVAIQLKPLCCKLQGIYSSIFVAFR